MYIHTNTIHTIRVRVHIPLAVFSASATTSLFSAGIGEQMTSFDSVGPEHAWPCRLAPEDLHLQYRGLQYNEEWLVTIKDPSYFWHDGFIQSKRFDLPPIPPMGAKFTWALEEETGGGGGGTLAS